MSPVLLNGDNGFCTPAIGNMIREGNIRQITSAIQTGVKGGMIERDSAIRALFDAGLVSARAAYDKAINRELFEDLVGS